jgi:pimeloyl-ACP methyl ester carboxylesterase
MTTYVLIPGACHGGWCYDDLAAALRSRGHRVLTITPTGVAERAHLLHAGVNLETHVADVLSEMSAQRVDQAVLVGHSYGGMVITGVADRVPDRIRRLVYVDAFLPDSGESVVTMVRSPQSQRFVRALVDSAKNGLMPPAWVKPGTPPPTDVPQPVRTFTQPLALTNPAGRRVPATYILTVEAGKAEADDDFFPFAQRARARGFTSYVLRSDHVAERTAPRELSDLLLRTP